MPTTRLHFDDPLLLGFSGAVTRLATFEGAPSVVLDRTAFYPEAGGQLGDRGTLGGAQVLDVQIDAAGDVHHLVASVAPFAVGEVLEGSVDASRRRLHMALHTGQHMLSRALEDVAFAPTVSSRLGESAATVDVDVTSLDERRLAEAESLVNAIVEEDLAVRAFFPDPDELAALPLRRAPKVERNIRVVAIGDFDVSPCGGTHCTHTAQVGVVRVSSVERDKGRVRVTFSAGRRARGELFDLAQILTGLGRELTSGPRDVPQAVERLRRDLHGAREALDAARSKVTELRLPALLASVVEGRVVASLGDASIEELRAVARGLALARPDAVALLAGTGDAGLSVVCSRGAESAFDCGALVKRLTAVGGGRGGGRAEHAEGRLPALTDWRALVTSALAER